MTTNLKATISSICLIALVISSVVLMTFGFYILACSLMVLLPWAIFSAFHSCGHNAYFKDRKINDIFGYIFSIYLVVPYYGWKIHHAGHHKWTGVRSKDPTSGPASLPPKEELKVFNILWKLWVPFITLAHVGTHLWNYKSIIAQTGKNESLKRKVILSFVIIPLGHIVLASTLGMAFYIPWSVGMVFFVMTSDIVLLSQHAMLPVVEDSKRPLSRKEHIDCTRSISFGWFIDRLILLNFGEHTKHHLKPTLPHFELDRVSVDNEIRVNGFKWIKELKSLHIRDVLEVSYR